MFPVTNSPGNPNLIFASALANGPHTEPFDINQWRQQQARTAALQSATQGQNLENQKTQIQMQGDQALRDAIKNASMTVPVGPPPPGAAGQPPIVGLDDEGQPIYDHQAVANSVAQAPMLNISAVVRELNARGHGDKALTFLQSYGNAIKTQLDNAKQDLDLDQTRNAAIGQRVQGLLSAAYPKGPGGPVDEKGFAAAQAEYPALKQELEQKYGAQLPDTFDVGALDAKYRSHVGQDEVLKAQKTAADINELGTRAEYQHSEAEKNRITVDQMKRYIQNPEQGLAEIDAMAGTDADLKPLAETAKTAFQFAMGRGDVQGARQAVNDFQQQVGRITEGKVSHKVQLQNETDPTKLAFDVKKAGLEETARAKAQAAQFGGSNATSQTADDVANYRIPFSQAVARLPGAARDALLAQIKAINPNFQAAQYDVAKKTEENFTSGPGAKSANALNTMMGHLEVLDRAADALKNGNIQVLNRIANGLGVQTGKSAKTVYDTILHRVGPEISTAYLAAGGSVGERGTNEEDFSSKQSPEQIHANIAVSAQLADSKIKALQDQYTRGTYGRGQQKLISEEAEATRQKLASKSPVAGMVTMKAPNGQTKPVPADQVAHYQQLGATVVK